MDLSPRIQLGLFKCLSKSQMNLRNAVSAPVGNNRSHWVFPLHPVTLIVFYLYFICVGSLSETPGMMRCEMMRCEDDCSVKLWPSLTYQFKFKTCHEKWFNRFLFVSAPFVQIDSTSCPIYERIVTIETAVDDFLQAEAPLTSLGFFCFRCFILRIFSLL